MRVGLILVSSLLAASLSIGCSPYDPDLGDSPFRCGTSDPKCPDGYVCDDSVAPTGVCVIEGSGPLPDAGEDPDPADAGIFVCNNDSMIEPNEDIGEATTGPIPDQMDTWRLVGLAICSDTAVDDIDVFRFRVDVAEKNIRVDIENNQSKGELIAEILNSTGVPIKAGSYDQTNTVLRVEVANAAVGTYYAQVRGSAAGIENNYNLDIELTGP